VAISSPESGILTNEAAIPSLAAEGANLSIAWLGVSPVGFTGKFADLRGPSGGWMIENLRGDSPTAANWVRAGAAPGRSIIAERPNDGNVTQIWTRPGNVGPFERGATVPGPSAPFSVLVVDSNLVLLGGADPAGGGFVRVLRSADGGLTFDDGNDISAARMGVEAVHLAWDGLGTVGACWVDYRNDPPSLPRSNPDVFATTFDLNLSTIGRPVRVDDTGLATSHQLEPDCAFLPDGRLLVAWTDDRSSQTGDFDIYSAVSSLDRLSFSPSVRIDDAPNTQVAHQSSPSVVVDGNDSAYAAFLDDRNLRQEIFYVHLSVANGTITAGQNQGVPDVNEPARFPAMTITPSGIIYLAWQGDGARVMLTSARGPVLGGGGPPSCEWMGPQVVSPLDGAVSYVAGFTDPEGWETVSQVNVSMDGSPASAGVDLPWARFSFDPAQLAGGNHSIHATATDREGMTGSCAITFSVIPGARNTAAPVINVSWPHEYSTAVWDVVRVEANVTDPDSEVVTTWLSIDGSPWELVSSERTWAYERLAAGLSTGRHVLVFVATDGQAFGAAATREFTVRRESATNFPYCYFAYPALGTPIARNATVAGFVGDLDGEADILDASFVVFPTGISGELLQFKPFVLTFQVPDRFNAVTIRIIVTDREGRFVECQTSYAIAGAAISSPTITILEPSSGTVFLDPEFVRIRGEAEAPEGTVSSVILWAHGGDEYRAYGTTAWTFSLDVANWSSGIYHVFGASIDNQGRISPTDQVAFAIVRSSEGLSKPLVVLDSIASDPRSPIAGEGSAVVFWASNYGNVAVEGLRYRVTATKAADANGPVEVLALGELSLSPLSQNVSIRIPWRPQTPGEFDVRVELNFDGQFPADQVVKPNGTDRVVVATAMPGVATPPGSALLLLLGAVVAAAITFAAYRRFVSTKEQEPLRPRRRSRGR
jgi:hypothetical protein